LGVKHALGISEGVTFVLIEAAAHSDLLF